jgi:hypothetical protein
VNSQNLPKKGDKLFLMHREVVVTQVCAIFRLIKVHYAEEATEFYLDACALTIDPDYTNTISLWKLMRRNSFE